MPAQPTTATPDAPALTPAMLERFDREGYLILTGVLEPAVLDGVRSELTALVDMEADRLMALDLIDDPMRDEPFDLRLVKLFAGCMDEAPDSYRFSLHRPGMFDLFFHARVLDAMEQLLGPEIRLYPNYTVRPKLPEHEATEVLWHQDGGYTASGDAGVNQLRMVNVWSPLVPARVANGCMQFIPGTHKLGVVPHVKKKYYLEIEPQYLQPRLDQAVNVECDPGDVVLFHNLMFHVGLPNRSGRVRWSADWRYQDATQPTMRPERGHLARSRKHPRAAVRDAAHWAALSFV